MQAALDEVMKGRTTFVIAHRLATIRNATRILVFEGGRIIEAGNFDELVRQGGRFAELARTQFMVAETAKPPADALTPSRPRDRDGHANEFRAGVSASRRTTS